MKFDNNTVALIVIGAICLVCAFVMGDKAESIISTGIGAIGGFIGGVAVVKAVDK